MTSGGDALKRLRRARRLTLGQLAERTRQIGRPVSASQIGKVERGERRLSDDVLEALAAALDLDDSERQQVEVARSGAGALDVADQLLDLDAKLTAGIERLSGELRGQVNQIMDRLDRLRDLLRP